MIHFLASIPRSGSTLLASLLGQREDTYVSPTSNLGETLTSVVTAFQKSSATKAAQCTNEELYRTLFGVVQAKYSDYKENVIIDKGRGWPEPVIMETMGKAFGRDIKIVATVRPMVECVASFFVIDKGDNIREWIKKSHLFNHLMISYESIKNGYEKYPEQFCLVEYKNLVEDPQIELDRVADFLDIKRVDYNPHIEQVKENDNAWNIKDLHKLDSTISPSDIDPKKILGEEYFDMFQGGEFWNNNPNPLRPKKPLDLSLEAAIRGDSDKAYQILKEYEKLYPDCDRTKFNLGWHEMERGNLLKGHKLTNHGRAEDVFGSPDPNLSTPMWNGEKNCTVLMNMEGGTGDQIHGIRYAKNIARYGNKVIVAGDEKLVKLCKDVEGVTVFCQSEVASGIYHDYWYPNMSITIPLELEWSDISGKPYILRDGESEGKIGLKWSGNPKFEHEQHRLFPKDLLWDAVSGFEDRCISLQKETNTTPSWLDSPSLKEWEDTRRVISKCELVISSCTAVAHLAAAMGVETWVVTPLMAYYLWTMPGNKTPYYNSMTLFRQNKYGDWSAPFINIKTRLKEKYYGKKLLFG